MPRYLKRASRFENPPKVRAIHRNGTRIPSITHGCSAEFFAKFAIPFVFGSGDTAFPSLFLSAWNASSRRCSIVSTTIKDIEPVASVPSEN
jgi:hypothetical protein